jgi:hypothetical protein
MFNPAVQRQRPCKGSNAAKGGIAGSAAAL